MAVVKFYRGKEEDYDLRVHKDGIYFCPDTHNIIMNGVSYGYDPKRNKGVKQVEYTAPATLKITYSDDTTSTISLQPLLTEANRYADEAVPANWYEGN